MSAALLDVNVLIALFDTSQANNRIALRWFETNADAGWATCPITENGYLRILANSKSLDPVPTLGVLKLELEKTKRLGRYEFWPDDLTMLDEDAFDLGRVFGPGQLTDVYLLGLAVARKGVLVTFDRTIPTKAVKGAGPEHLEVLGV